MILCCDKNRTRKKTFFILYLKYFDCVFILLVFHELFFYFVGIYSKKLEFILLFKAWII